jgi:hypothetical protein
VPWNVTVEGYISGQSEFEVSLLPPPAPAPEKGLSFLWTIHPKRRQQANVDARRKRNPFRRLSVNTDFRAWRRVVWYQGGKRPTTPDDPVLQ